MNQTEHWASGRWKVKPGKEDEFVQRWTDWLTWSRDNIPGFISATLIRDMDDPQYFTSFSPWPDAATRDAWINGEGTDELFPKARDLCDEFQGGANFTRASSV